MISKNGVAVSILVIEAILSAVGLEFEAGTVAKAVEGTLVAAGLLLAIWNQLNREDVRAFFFKK